MSVRIVCENCSGELQVPRVSAGKKIRCPLCGTVFVAAALDVPVKVPVSSPASGFDPSTPWSPINEEDFDNPIPWYILLGAIAPAGMLGFVTHEPAAFAVAAVLVMIGLFVATRRDWSRWSRFMGVVSLALIGYGVAAAVNLYGQGSFAQFSFRSPFTENTEPDRPPATELGRAAWNTFSPPGNAVKLLFPGTVIPSRLDHRSGIDVFVYEAKFPKNGVIFALHSFKIPTVRFDEKNEEINIAKMKEIVPWIFFDGETDEVKKAFYFDHPSNVYEFSVYDYKVPAGKPPIKKSSIVCQAYLIRDQAYLVSVLADHYEPIKPLAEKFFASFRLLQPAESMRAPQRDAEPDWKALGRPPIPKVKPLASYRGHHRPPILVLAFSLDGQSMVTGSGREHIIKWDLESGHGTRIVGAEAFPFFAVHPSGKEMVVAFPGGINAPKILFLPLDIPVPELFPANTDYIGFSADRKTAFVSLETQITAWDSNDANLWNRVAADSPLACLAVSRDGRLLASAATIAAGAGKEPLPKKEPGVETAKGKESLRKEPTIKLWDVSNVNKGVDLKTWNAHVALPDSPVPIQQLAFSPDGKTLASAGFDTTVRIWDLSDLNNPKPSGELIHIGKQIGESVSSVEFSNDGKLLASGDFSGVVRIWEAGSWKLLHEFRACEASESVQALRFSPDDAKLAVAVEMGIGRAGVNLFEIKSLPAVAADVPSIGLQLTEEPPLIKEK